MPKKLNKAGQQQEYVPSGNGDASGEYADDGGSNRHFTAFKKPEEAVKTEDETVVEENNNGGVVEEEKVEDKEQLKLNLNEKMTKGLQQDYASLKSRNYDDNSISKRLTENLLNGKYGFYERTSEIEKASGYDAYEVVVKQWMAENIPQKYYFKDGSGWVSTYNKDLVSLKEEVYTEEQYREIRAKEFEKNAKQTESDIEVEKTFGDNCQVAFGKSMDKDYLKEVVEGSKIVANDFPDMKGFIRGIGDRNALRKLSEARTEKLLADENYVNNLAKTILEERKYENPNMTIDQATNLARDKIRGYTLNIANCGGGVMAFWQPGQKCLIMLPKSTKGDIAANQQRYYDVNWHSSNKPISTYYHEMGHAIDSMIAELYNKKLRELKETKGVDEHNKLFVKRAQFTNDIQDLKYQNFSEEYNNAYLEIINREMGTNIKSIKEFNNFYNRQKYEASTKAENELAKKGIRKYVVSEYGNTNLEEFVAESFAAYYTGMKNPLADKVVNRVLEFYNELRK